MAQISLHLHRAVHIRHQCVDDAFSLFMNSLDGRRGGSDQENCAPDTYTPSDYDRRIDEKLINAGLYHISQIRGYRDVTGRGNDIWVEFAWSSGDWLDRD
ncbi:hypothetical protein PIB30_045635 [Stylosanthes scabra]|uniref:Uncharacterized protein n=1 Tax=Stylosanthes scabra TaxID=79078 RepID=A0ABU6VG69_9FABA|nr:hypothetical protein [Stylosanthes scabra]